jgi:hypothetical protein
MTDTATTTAQASDTAAANGDATAVNGGAPADGVDAEASPPCVNDPANPACARRMIAVDKLTAHPGNVREDLDLTDEFCASVAASGSGCRCSSPPTAVAATG